MTTYTKFSLAAKIRLHEKFTSEIFYWRKYPDLRYQCKLIKQNKLVFKKLLRTLEGSEKKERESWRRRWGEGMEFEGQLPHNFCFSFSAERPACTQRPLHGEGIQRASPDGAQRDTGRDNHSREGKGHQLLHQGIILIFTVRSVPGKYPISWSQSSTK